ncbi:hypercellular protein HypA [Metarhizium album ARSEF 1941]|uniref:Hypercellular protein HypA n=1 Tax=Metarhizium album (strain ARSEF 1941) TaxID=1081103 RepID=A0A0B2WRS8_METAS|nr:hypercellular protein HypA [Metarhizium album ARSEF 1941]KHN95690.1 hypercellular protein HypA [Metarhizium album ARSEF 1941]
MSSDPLLPIAPARARALLLPLGKIKAQRFAEFVKILQGEYVVHLRDISADGRPNRNMFSPLAYPDGAMLYDLITHLPPASHLSLSPFDLYRQPLVLIALADGEELQGKTFSKRYSASRAATIVERNIHALYQELEELRDNYPKVLVHQVVIFDYAPPEGMDIPMPDGIVAVPPKDRRKRTTIKTVMCDVSSLVLAEMTTLAKSFEAMTTIESPGSLSARNMDGHTWGSNGDGSPVSISRRNSQFSQPQPLSRSNSTSSVADKTQARLSMPLSTSRSSSNAAGRPSTPPRSGLSATPMSPEDGRSGSSTGLSSPEQKPQRPDPTNSPDVSRDRVSVQGFGPGGANDRWRLRGKGRASVLVGSIYLQAGRWSDSLRELSEGATAARSLNDHIWHGKALELIIMNLVLLGWSRLEFQVPAVCLPNHERPVSMSGLLKSEADNADSSQPRHIRHLQSLLPELLDRILGLYSRISSENLPPLPLAETTVRFCKLLSAMHFSGGKLDEKALDAIVTGELPYLPPSSSPQFTVTPSRQQIMNMLFKAFPSSGAEILTIADRTSILSGIANVLGALGYHRKKAMVIRELVSVLIDGLVEARTRGAAEAGIHPAAGLVSLVPGSEKPSAAGVALDLGEGDIEDGIEPFLDLLCRSYGVVGFDMRKNRSGPDDSDSATVARLLIQSSTRFFGFTEIKLNILRACINFSEALPDFEGVLKFSGDLLRTAGSGIAPGPKREDVAPHIDKEEQNRLVTNIARTTVLTERIGLEGLAAEYWDEFLVRGIALEPPPNTRTPIPHAKSVLPGANASRASQDVNPFIYNPFLKEPAEVAAENLVAGELATFKVTLQNTYDVEVDIENMRLDTEGVEFESVPEHVVLGPYRTQVVRLKGRPKASGPIKVTGAVVKIRGCRERRFPTFPKHWTPSRAEKIKCKGPPALDSSSRTAPVKPEPEVLDLNVIQPQPLVVVKSTSLAQSSVMMLEGERQVFTVTMQNTSTTTPVDFLLFSFKDSTQGPLQTALDNRDATPAELYEYELVLMKNQALRLPRNGQYRYMPPGGEATFEFEILGKPGLTHATIQADYTCLGVPRDDVTEQFYTRQVLLDLTVTVNASVELSRIDAVPMQGQLPSAFSKRLGGDEKEKGASTERYFLLTADVRNAWPSQMSIQLEGEDGMTVEDSILPGKTSRVVIPMRRVYLEDPHEPVPSLDPSRKRQFVVSASKISPDMERASREAFWYREKLLENLKATWRTTSVPERNGAVELRNIRLTPRMIEVIRFDEVDITVSVDGAPDNVAYVDEFMQMKVQIANRAARPIWPLVRLMPALCHRPLNVALDYTRKFAWNGALQQRLPELKGHEVTEFAIGVTALCRGEFELAASVEEVQVLDEGLKEAQEPGRRPSDTQKLMNAALGVKERRVWYARQPCILRVRDRE